MVTVPSTFTLVVGGEMILKQFVVKLEDGKKMDQTMNKHGILAGTSHLGSG